MEKLRDIKGIVAVSDYSIYYLFAYILVGVLVFAVVVYFLTRQKRRKKPTQKEIALKNLKGIDYEKPKDIAYKFTLNIPFFVNDTNKKEIDELLDKLENYKYKKEIPDVDEVLKESIKKVIGRLK